MKAKIKYKFVNLEHPEFRSNIARIMAERAAKQAVNSAVNQWMHGGDTYRASREGG